VHQRGVTGGALNLKSTGYPDHGRYGDLPLQRKISTAELGIEPGTSWLVVGSSDHQATRLFVFLAKQASKKGEPKRKDIKLNITGGRLQRGM
jgi:hypothetical protein